MKTDPTNLRQRPSLLAHPIALFIACLVVTLLAIAVATARENENRPDRGGQQPPPPPEEIARHIMAEFDADKNGVLDLGELTAHIVAMHERHGPPGLGLPPRQGPARD